MSYSIRNPCYKSPEDQAQEDHILDMIEESHRAQAVRRANKGRWLRLREWCLGIEEDETDLLRERTAWLKARNVQIPWSEMGFGWLGDEK